MNIISIPNYKTEHEDTQNIMSSNKTIKNGGKDFTSKIVNKLLIPHAFYMIVLILILIMSGYKWKHLFNAIQSVFRWCRRGLQENRLFSRFPIISTIQMRNQQNRTAENVHENPANRENQTIRYHRENNQLDINPHVFI